RRLRAGRRFRRPRHLRAVGGRRVVLLQKGSPFAFGKYQRSPFCARCNRISEYTEPCLQRKLIWCFERSPTAHVYESFICFRKARCASVIWSAFFMFLSRRLRAT